MLVLLQALGLNFAPSCDLQFGRVFAYSVPVEDLNGDGKLDIAGFCRQ